MPGTPRYSCASSVSHPWPVENTWRQPIDLSPKRSARSARLSGSSTGRSLESRWLSRRTAMHRWPAGASCVSLRHARPHSSCKVSTWDCFAASGHVRSPRSSASGLRKAFDRRSPQRSASLREACRSPEAAIVHGESPWRRAYRRKPAFGRRLAAPPSNRLASVQEFAARGASPRVRTVRWRTAWTAERHDCCFSLSVRFWRFSW